MSKKKYDYDDGRSIADMSSIGQPNLFTFRNPKDRKEQVDAPEENQPERPWESKPEMPKEDRRAYVLAAVLTAVGVGAVFFVGLGRIIWLLTVLL